MNGHCPLLLWPLPVSPGEVGAVEGTSLGGRRPGGEGGGGGEENIIEGSVLFGVDFVN